MLEDRILWEIPTQQLIDTDAETQSQTLDRAQGVFRRVGERTEGPKETRDSTGRLCWLTCAVEASQRLTIKEQAYTGFRSLLIYSRCVACLYLYSPTTGEGLSLKCYLPLDSVLLTVLTVLPSSMRKDVPSPTVIDVPRVRVRGQIPKGYSHFSKENGRWEWEEELWEEGVEGRGELTLGCKMN